MTISPELLRDLLAAMNPQFSPTCKKSVGTVGTLERAAAQKPVPTKSSNKFQQQFQQGAPENTNEISNVQQFQQFQHINSKLDGEAGKSGVAEPPVLEPVLELVGTEIDAEPDFTVYLDDPAFGQQVADERNSASVAAGRTDRYCACQKLAAVAVGRGRVSPKNPEGVQRWLCQECFDAGAPFPIPTPRKISSGVADAPPIELKIIPRPDEPARADWWEQPVEGWREGRLIITPIVGDDTYEIDLNEGQTNDDDR